MGDLLIGDFGRNRKPPEEEIPTPLDLHKVREVQQFIERAIEQNPNIPQERAADIVGTSYWPTDIIIKTLNEFDPAKWKEEDLSQLTEFLLRLRREGLIPSKKE